MSEETTPLLSSHKPSRNVTFDPAPSIIHVPPSTSPIASRSGLASSASTFNSKLRRRNSHGAPALSYPPIPPSKIGPQRTTKTVQKLKLLPNPELGEDGPDEESGRDVYSQYTRIKDPTARRDAARLGKADRERLPRVTAYCTAGKYQMDNLMRFLKGRGKMKGANPKLIDECIYTPYSYQGPLRGQERKRSLEIHSMPVQGGARERRHSDSRLEVEDNNLARREEVIGSLQRDEAAHSGSSGVLNGHVDHQQQNTGISQMHSGLVEHVISDELAPVSSQDAEGLDFDIVVHTPEIFLFDYGVVVIWGMPLRDERRFLKELEKFENEKLPADDVEVENFNFYYTREYQARIYNDFITLRDKGNYMTKLAISHALAQSVKTSLFEEIITTTIETCKEIPASIALTGTISLSRREINMQIGELFILRINIHLNGSVLDTPELFWVEPQLEPVYQAVRSYLEIEQRVGLLTERSDVIADLLAVLKDQLSHGHGEKLEWIVIVLIAMEILVAAINIVVDIYAGGE